MYVRNFSKGVDPVGGVLPHDGQGEGRADVPRMPGRLRVDRSGGLRDQPVAGGRRSIRARASGCSSTRCSSTTSTAWTRRRATALRQLFDEEDLPRNVLLRRRHADPGRDDAPSARCSRSCASVPVAEGRHDRSRQHARHACARHVRGPAQDRRRDGHRWSTLTTRRPSQRRSRAAGGLRGRVYGARATPRIACKRRRSWDVGKEEG